MKKSIVVAALLVAAGSFGFSGSNQVSAAEFDAVPSLQNAVAAENVNYSFWPKFRDKLLDRPPKHVRRPPAPPSPPGPHPGKPHPAPAPNVHRPAPGPNVHRPAPQPPKHDVKPAPRPKPNPRPAPKPAPKPAPRPRR